MDADDEPPATRPGSLRSTMHDPSHSADRDGIAIEPPAPARSGGDRRARTAALALVAVLLAAPLATVALAGGPAPLAGSGPIGLADGQSEPTLTLTDVSVPAGETGTMRLALTEAPDGLAGVQASVAVEDGSVGTIEGASYPDEFALSEDPVVSDDGTEVALSAADAEGAVEPGATNVTLASIEVRGEAAGEAPLSIRVERLGAEDGNRIRPATENATLTVGDGGDGGSAGDSNDADGDSNDADGDSNAGDEGTESDGAGGAGTDGSSEADGVTTGTGPTGLPLALAALALAGLLARLRR